MARQANVIPLISGSGSTSWLQKPVGFAQGRKCRRIRMRTAAVFTNSSTIVNLTAAYALLILQNFYANITTYFGDVNQDTVDASMTLNQMREMYAFAEGRDFTINGFQVNAITGTNVSFTASTTTTIQVEAVRTFQLVRAAQDVTDYCPGCTQMKQMQFGITPAASALVALSTVTLTTTSISASIILDDMPAEGQQDIWANVIRVRQTTTPGESITLPIPGGGAIIACWDEQTTGAAAPYTLINIKADDVDINGIINYSQYLQGYQDDLPIGWFDVSTLVAPLYTTAQFIDPNILDTGEQIVFNQPNNDQATPKITVLFIPTMTTGARNQAGDNIQNGATGQLNSFQLSNLHAVADTNNPPQAGSAASISPMAIVKPTDTGYATISGTRFAVGQVPGDSIPTPKLNNVAAAVTNAGGASTAAGSSTIAKATKKIALSIPGYNSPNKNPQTSTAGHNAVAGQILSTLKASSGAAAAVAPKIVKPKA